MHKPSIDQVEFSWFVGIADIHFIEEIWPSNDSRLTPLNDYISHTN